MTNGKTTETEHNPLKSGKCTVPLTTAATYPGPYLC